MSVVASMYSLSLCVLGVGVGKREKGMPLWWLLNVWMWYAFMMLFGRCSSGRVENTLKQQHSRNKYFRRGLKINSIISMVDFVLCAWRILPGLVAWKEGCKCDKRFLILSHFVVFPSAIGALATLCQHSSLDDEKFHIFSLFSAPQTHSHTLQTF